MNKDDLFALMESWGYFLPPKSHPHSPGYPGLVVAMRPHPTQEHFDPESMEICLYMPQATMERIHLTQRGLAQAPRRVCPGHITLRDRMNKTADFYTYGGQLAVAQRPNLTIYALSSTAPVLSLTADDEDSLPEQLVAETERLVSRHRARWGRDDAGYAQRLADIEPVDLYRAALRSIRLNYNRHPVLRTQFSYLFARVQQEIQWQATQDDWTENGPYLMDLLALPDRA